MHIQLQISDLLYINSVSLSKRTEVCQLQVTECRHDGKQLPITSDTTCGFACFKPKDPVDSAQLHHHSPVYKHSYITCRKVPNYKVTARRKEKEGYSRQYMKGSTWKENNKANKVKCIMTLNSFFPPHSAAVGVNVGLTRVT